MVLPDQRENGRVASGNADLVMAGIRAEVNQPPDFRSSSANRVAPATFRTASA
jgi:hypothetical protein